MGDDTTLADDNVTKELVQPESEGRNVRNFQGRNVKRHVLLIVPDGKLQVPGHDTLLLVITRRVTRKLENLSCKVLEDGSEVDYTSNASCSHEIVVEG